MSLQQEKSDGKRLARDRFGWQRRVLFDRELSAHARCLALIVADYVNGESGIAYPSLRTLADASGFTKRVILKLLPQLAARDHLEITPGNGRGHANEYRLKGERGAPLYDHKRGNGVHPLRQERGNAEHRKGERKAQKGGTRSTHNQLKNQLKEPAENTYTADFETFWEVYPRKSGKKPAFKAWLKALKEKRATPQRIIEAAERYATAQASTPPDKIKMAQGWLNDDRFNDEPQTHNHANAPRATGFRGMANALARTINGDHDQ